MQHAVRSGEVERALRTDDALHDVLVAAGDAEAAAAITSTIRSSLEPAEPRKEAS